MAEFYINTETITRQSTRLTETGNSVRAVQSRVSNVANGLSGIGLGQVAPAISALEGRLARHVGKMNSLSSALGMSMLKYVGAESNIMGIPLLLNPDFGAVAGVIASNTVSGLTGFDFPVWEGPIGASCAYEVERGCVIVPFLPNVEYSWEDEYGSHKATYGVSPEVSAEVFGFGTKSYINDDPEMVHLLSVGATESVSVLSGEGEANGRFGSAKGEYGVLNAEANAGVYAGLFDAHGNFAPGVGAEASASVSLFKAEGEARLGDDYYGVYVKGGVEVCSAEAKASIDVGLYDSDGNFNPSLGAGVEAEAVLAQATGSVGRRIMGTDIGVQGSVGFGVGAHAKVGFQDGTFTFDAGAYLGVGGSISIELDFSDTYDTIVKGWNTVTDAAVEAWDVVTDVASDAWDTVTDVASNAWDAVTDVASDAWDFITFWD